jgi:receptor-type tyrosine-protein phosphatase R
MSSESEEGNDEELLSNSSRPMSQLELRASLLSVGKIHAEFWSMPFNHELTPVSGSSSKNRYRTILPNIHSRVMLPQMGNDLSSSYINANYIRGFRDKPRQYIATQGPLSNTVYDFWRMVVMTQSPVIVMLTNLEENNKSKCSPYFPVVGDNTFGDIRVVAIRSDRFNGYLVTELEIHWNDKKHKVCHFWYNSWPDHGIPESPVPLLQMLEHVNICRRPFPLDPVVVHCSAGIGRSGCFIGIDIGVKQLKEEGFVDLLKILCHIRQDRGGMIQTNEQYEFVHRALLLYEQELEKRRTEGTDGLLPFFSE